TENDSPFVYRDTATSRAGLAAVHRRFRGQRIVIVGLGGSGSYILDQVAKTEVDSILLIDGDTFDNHNAFRAPGAPTLKTLRERPTKASY
ncbi:ThiF family adenylyltransferase, partial [Streptomyces sp. SID6648]|nr:ThiF family adenylyltransferase [Streptomyces sp. SID6648]